MIISKSKSSILLGFISVFLFGVSSSDAFDIGGDLNVYYKNYSLVDHATSAKADGIQAAGISLRTKWFNTAYETTPGANQKELKGYNASTEGSLKKNYEQIKAGLKPLKFFSDIDLQVEYSSDVYLAKMNNIDRFYRQEMLFLGEETGDEKYSKSLSNRLKIGLFAAQTTVQELNISQNQYSEPKSKNNAYGLLLQVTELYLPMELVGIPTKNVGFLIDDLKIQYQIGGGNAYLFGFGLGLAGKVSSMTWEAKYSWDIYTDKTNKGTSNDVGTTTGKLAVGVGYKF